MFTKLTLRDATALIDLPAGPFVGGSWKMRDGVTVRGITELEDLRRRFLEGEARPRTLCLPILKSASPT